MSEANRQRKVNMSESCIRLGVTAFLMLLFNPVWLFDVGFQLSFSAVAAIVLLQPGLYGLLSGKNRLLHKAWVLVTVSVAAQIGTAPVSYTHLDVYKRQVFVVPKVRLLLRKVIMHCIYCILKIIWGRNWRSDF